MTLPLWSAISDILSVRVFADTLIHRTVYRAGIAWQLLCCFGYDLLHPLEDSDGQPVIVSHIAGYTSLLYPRGNRTNFWKSVPIIVTGFPECTNTVLLRVRTFAQKRAKVPSF